MGALAAMGALAFAAFALGMVLQRYRLGGPIVVKYEVEK